MKAIMFRGIGINEGTFVYSMTISNGTIKRKKDCVFLEVNGKWIGIKPETLGQFTGLCDKNGKEIFERDKVLILFPKWSTLGGTIPTEIIETIIVFKDCGFTCEIPANKNKHPVTHYKSLGVDAWEYEIIGNIHENPELLK